MDQQILDFLTSHHVGVLCPVRKDGSPHAAVLHYSFRESPLEFYFSTSSESRKYEALAAGVNTPAALVIGMSEQEWITLQLNGVVTVISDPNQLIQIQETHYAKHPNSAKFKNDPDTGFLRFTPTWWRYSDFNTEPVTIIGG